MDVERNPGPHTCPECGRDFTYEKGLNEHIANFHSTENLTCGKCPFSTKWKKSLKRHHEIHNRPELPPKRSAPQPTRSPSPLAEVPPPACKTTALKKRLATYRIDGNGADPELFFDAIEPQINAYAQQELKEKSGIKLQLTMAINFYMPHNLSQENERHFWSLPLPLFRDSEYDIKESFPKILKSIDEFQRQGSGWSIKQILFVDVHIVVCKPLKGACGVDLPMKIRNSLAITNIKNDDNQCFKYCVLAAFQNLPPKSNHNRPSKYKDNQSINFDGLEFPVATKDIGKFEKNNPGIAVNVYGYEDGEVIPLRISNREKAKWIHLLLYNGHYCLIRNLSRFLAHKRKHHGQAWYCPRCLMHRTTKKLLLQHLDLCRKTDPTRIKLPNDTTLKFRNIDKMLRMPLCIYADFEALTTRIEPTETDSKTIKLQNHTPCGYGIQVVRNCCGKPTYETPETYRGPNCVERFLLKVSQIATEHQNKLNNPAPMPDTDEMSDTCHICKKEITDKKVRDHCHICGNFRGSAHNDCNQAYQVSRDIVVVFHNLRKYDGHMIMEKLGTVAKLQGYGIDVVAKTMDQYISFSLKHKKEPGVKDQTYRIKFIDSLAFLNSSLENLVENLPKDQFHALGNTEFTENQKKLLLRKGVYPYDYMDSWEKFSKPLPSKLDFFSLLNGEHINELDYQHAKQVWSEFKLSNMGDYHDLYLLTDVLLLADVFEGFRSFSLKTYGLDPAHYLTTPALAMDACLKMTGVHLELFSDVDMYLFCEQGIRGGISVISHRYAKANNSYIPETYDESKENSYILYLDMNNLYGTAMSLALPVGEFEWVAEGDWFEDKDYGYILEVDLDYPPRIHPEHNDYPLAPEHKELTTFSPYCEELKKKMGLKLPVQKKLVPNLFHKKKYILHHRNLKQCMDLGMHVSKVHRALRFRQKRWMEPYISLNARLRAQASSSFDKDLLKLFNNACFGKMLENVRKYKQVELVTSGHRFEKLTANPRYRTSCRFNEDLVGVCMLRPSVTLCKPIYCGLTVLDLSKELMYNFHYNIMAPRYKDRLKLLFTDTDSLCYYIQTEDVYKDMQADADHYDFSEYPENHFLYDRKNHKVLGKMKDELNGIPIQEFVGLRSKMYSIKCGRVEKKRAKGIKRSVVKKTIKHKDYYDTLFNETSMNHEMTRLGSTNHQIYLERVTKKSLSAFDDKRWLLDCIRSNAYGHCDNK